ncbi:probable glucan endo-1,3-beta-glucosidase At4g16260 [Salvia miltiorrhiza]|uniref:probable glucan endo-1,3-beta-glucosidase At4g16260 n=1 Tax=Salvia miltiorrhiza TaxID=226208 RepID=UPI0025ABBF6E|nr:probable glucan endo-1,3-beta-glucosidase At4g16260 [Salvia miltiorrhiza]
MATTATHFIITSLLIVISLDFTFGGVGVCFGRLGNNLPSVQTTIALYKKYNIRSMRLYDPHPPTLRALAGTGIRLMLGIPNDRLRPLANCPDAATTWVRTNILTYPNVTFRYISVGNEVDPDSDPGRFVLPAMQNIYRAIRAARVGGRIRVSTSIKTDLLERSYPPQAGEFKCSVNWYIRPIVEFLRDTRAPLLANVYPYFAYINDRRNINLSYALLQPNSGVVAGGVYYDNLYYAILDAVEAAMDRILAASPSLFSDQKQSAGSSRAAGSETGWPSSTGGTTALDDGDVNTVENARIYNNNLMRIVKSGTPRRPGRRRRLETYIFAMFDENLKPGPAYERHFGIFSPDARPKYPLRFR